RPATLVRRLERLAAVAAGKLVDTHATASRLGGTYLYRAGHSGSHTVFVAGHAASGLARLDSGLDGVGGPGLENLAATRHGVGCRHGGVVQLWRAARGAERRGGGQLLHVFARGLAAADRRPGLARP